MSISSSSSRLGSSSLSSSPPPPRVRATSPPPPTSPSSVVAARQNSDVVLNGSDRSGVVQARSRSISVSGLRLAGSNGGSPGGSKRDRFARAESMDTLVVGIEPKRRGSVAHVAPMASMSRTGKNVKSQPDLPELVEDSEDDPNSPPQGELATENGVTITVAPGSGDTGGTGEAGPNPAGRPTPSTLSTEASNGSGGVGGAGGGSSTPPGGRARYQRRRGNRLFNEEARIRVERNVYVRIEQARDLDAWIAKRAVPDAFVVVRVGGGKSFQTSTKYQAAAPYWSEECVFEVDESFTNVGVEVWRERKKGNKLVGVIDFPQALIEEHDERMANLSWFPIQNVTSSTFVAGDLQLRLFFRPLVGDSSGKLQVTIVQARQLMTRKGTADAYVRLKLGDDEFKTAVVKKTSSPVFDATFEFEITDYSAITLFLTVLNREKLSEDTFLGEVRIPLQKVNPGEWIEKWYTVTQRGAAENAGGATAQAASPASQTAFSPQDKAFARIASDGAVGGSGANVGADGEPGKPLGKRKNRLSKSLSGIFSGFNWKDGDPGRDDAGKASHRRVGSVQLTGQATSPLATVPAVTIEVDDTAVSGATTSDGAGGDDGDSTTLPDDGLGAESTCNETTADDTSVLELSSDDDDLESLGGMPPGDDGAPAPGDHPNPPPLDSASSSIPPTPSTLSPSPSTGSLPRVTSVLAPTVEGEPALRLKLTYTEDRILPLGSYAPLEALLASPVGVDTVRRLGVVSRSREPLARTVIGIFHRRGRDVALIKELLTKEIADTLSPSVIFRGSTLTTKLVDVYMKLVGRRYLAIVKPVVMDIFRDPSGLEADPTRVDESEDPEANIANLQAVAQRVIDIVFDSVDLCPRPLREIFHHLQTIVVERWPDETEGGAVVRWTAVAGFIFLRFFCIGIITPHLNGIWPPEEPPDHATGRALTLVAKVIQNMANLALFGIKQRFMVGMNPFLEDNFDRMKAFLDAISCLDADDADSRIADPSFDVDLAKELALLHGHLKRNMGRLEMEEGVDEGMFRSVSAAVAAVDATDQKAAATEAAKTRAQEAKNFAAVHKNKIDTETAKQLKDADFTSKEKFLLIDKLRSKLSRGGTFLKYARRGKPERRFVYCVLTDRKVYWRKENKKKPGRKSFINFKDIFEIAKGCTTEVFRKKKKKDLASESVLCFSVLASSRTLDLQCETEVERDEWVQAFEFLLEWQGTPRRVAVEDEASDNGGEGGSGAVPPASTSTADPPTTATADGSESETERGSSASV